MPAESHRQHPMVPHDICTHTMKFSFFHLRNAILDIATTVHHDFGQFNESLSVSMAPSKLEELKSNPNVDWFEGDGRVIYCSIR